MAGDTYSQLWNPGMNGMSVPSVPNVASQGTVGTAASGISGLTGGLLTGGSIIGGILQGLGSAQQQNKITGEQKREFNLQTQLQQQQQANSLARQLQLSPLRDKVIAQLMNRAGMSPTQFNPLNYGSSSNSAPSQGGINLNALAQQNAQYQPGQGNSGQINAVDQAMLGQLGYGSPQQLQHQVNSGDLGPGYGYSLGLPGSNNGTGYGGQYGAQGLPSNMGQSWTPQGGSLGQGQAYQRPAGGQVNPTPGLYQPQGRQMTQNPYMPGQSQITGGTAGAVGSWPSNRATSPSFFNSLQSY